MSKGWDEQGSGGLVWASAATASLLSFSFPLEERRERFFLYFVTLFDGFEFERVFPISSRTPIRYVPSRTTQFFFSYHLLPSLDRCCSTGGRGWRRVAHQESRYGTESISVGYKDMRYSESTNRLSRGVCTPVREGYAFRILSWALHWTVMIRSRVWTNTLRLRTGQSEDDRSWSINLVFCFSITEIARARIWETG